MTRQGSKTSQFFLVTCSWLLLFNTSTSLKIAVFGGSGFVGRRVCQGLVQLDHEVVSISRSGRPPVSYASDAWVNKVEWIQADVMEDTSSTTTDRPSTITSNPRLILPSNLDAAVSCVGNVQPSQDWKQLFGLGFDDDVLRYENGATNERICELCKEAGARRFVFISVSYEVAKALEGPIEGYLDGKRQAERAASRLFGNDNTIVIGPSLIYGGRRFPSLGRLYRAFVESPVARAYVQGNTFLRNLSVAPLEDWLEAMIFSSPIDVETFAQVVCAAAVGLIDRDLAGGDRKQGFFNQNGKPVTYENVIFVDGTAEIERVAKKLTDDNELFLPSSFFEVPSQQAVPVYEGALIGKKPYLRPIPIMLTFGLLFWAVATQQFVSVVDSI